MDFDGNVQVVTHRLCGLVAITLLGNCLLSQGGDDAEIWKGRGKISKERDAREETRDVAFWKSG
jgi:hypothetical protein